MSTVIFVTSTVHFETSTVKVQYLPMFFTAAFIFAGYTGQLKHTIQYSSEVSIQVKTVFVFNLQ